MICDFELLGFALVATSLQKIYGRLQVKGWLHTLQFSTGFKPMSYTL